MPIDFGKISEQVNETEVVEVRPIIRGIKDVAVDGTLNFQSEEVDIVGSERNVTTNPRPERNIDDASSFVDANKVASSYVPNTEANSGPLEFARPNVPNDIVSQNDTVTATPGVDLSNFVTRDEASPLSGLGTIYGLNPIIPGKPLTDILNEVAERCARRILDELDGIDPSLRLEQLLNRASELCASGDFEQLRTVIDKIQQAKRDLVYDAISTITDPLERITKLHDMLVDAINTGAQDLVQEISGLISIEQFRSLLDGLDQLDPRKALDLINSEIRRLTDLGQFDKIQDLLNAVNIIQSQFAAFEAVVDNVFDEIGALLNEPERLIQDVQNRINEALDLGNYDEIQQIIAAYDAFRDRIEGILDELDPQAALQKLVGLANEALAKLDIGRYNRLLDQLADRICDQDFGILPELPSGDEIINSIGNI